MTEQENPMLASSDDVLDKVRTREVTGVFHSRKALVDAAEELLVAGFDRADIDVSASFDELQRRLSYGAIPAPDIVDVSERAAATFFGRRRCRGRGRRRRLHRR
jgi:hypothetical protein